MQFSLATIATAAMLLRAQTGLAAPAPAPEAAPAPLEGHLQGRAALLVCQFGGLFSGGGNAACSAEVSFLPEHPYSLANVRILSVSSKAKPTAVTATATRSASATPLRLDNTTQHDRCCGQPYPIHPSV